MASGTLWKNHLVIKIIIKIIDYIFYDIYNMVENGNYYGYNVMLKNLSPSHLSLYF